MVILVLSDLIYSLIFLFFCYFYKKKLKKIIAVLNDKYISLSHFSILVEGFPSYVNKEEDIAEHFREIIPEVKECNFVRDFRGTLLA